MRKTNRDKDSCCCRFCSVPRYPRPRRGYGRTSTGGWRPKNKNRARFRDKIIVGDSGNPAFLLIKDQPILIYCLLRGGCGSGPSIHLYRREIQATMDELCPGYKLEEFDFDALGLPSKGSSGSATNECRVAQVEGVVATQVSPNSAYAKHPRSKPANKGSNEFS